MAKNKKKYKIKKGKEQEQEEEKQENSVYSRFVGEYGRSAKRERTPEEKKEYKKLALFLVGWIILVASVYYAGVQFEQLYWESHEITEGIPYTTLIYTILGVVLFFVWLIYNGGFKKIDVTKFEKPDEMGYDEFCRFIDKLKERQRKAKYFLILFIPFVVVLLVDWWIMKSTLK